MKSYVDSTPHLHVGDSSFDDWFQAHEKACTGNKQLARDAYAAGMGDPLVVAASLGPKAVVELTPLQELVAKHYEGGEFSHITNTAQLDGCGDTLFKFCILEAGDAQLPGDLWGMLDKAVRQLRSLQGELES